MFFRNRHTQYNAKPEAPDPLYAGDHTLPEQLPAGARAFRGRV
jgi:Mn-containing catalase